MKPTIHYKQISLDKMPRQYFPDSSWCLQMAVESTPLDLKKKKKYNL